MRDGALQKRASEIGQKETLSVRLHELDEQVKDQVSKLKSYIADFSEDTFDSTQQDLAHPKWSDSPLCAVILNS